MDGESDAARRKPLDQLTDEELQARIVILAFELSFAVKYAAMGGLHIDLTVEDRTDFMCPGGWSHVEAHPPSKPPVLKLEK